MKILHLLSLPLLTLTTTGLSENVTHVQEPFTITGYATNSGDDCHSSELRVTPELIKEAKLNAIEQAAKKCGDLKVAKRTTNFHVDSKVTCPRHTYVPYAFLTVKTSASFVCKARTVEEN